jgi:hypothetical protein
LRILQTTTSKMRQRYLAVLPALPLVDALSLGNFQQITAILLPNACSAAYDGQIPSCTVSDFQTSCSLACQAGLGQVATNVQSGCKNVFVNPNALLGIVMNGGIIQALCPSVEKASSTVTRTSTTAVVVSSAAASVVTLPTASPGVTGGGGSTSRASTTAPAQSQTQVTIPTTRSTSAKVTTTSKSVASTSAESTTEVVSSAAPTSVTSVTSGESTSTSATQGGGGATSILSDTSTTSRKGSIATSTQSPAAASQNAKPQSDTGGGSPFDIASSASRIGGTTVSLLVTIAWVGVLIGR